MLFLSAVKNLLIKIRKGTIAVQGGQKVEAASRRLHGSAPTDTQGHPTWIANFYNLSGRYPRPDKRSNHDRLSHPRVRNPHPGPPRATMSGNVRFCPVLPTSPKKQTHPPTTKRLATQTPPPPTRHPPPNTPIRPSHPPNPTFSTNSPPANA